MQYFPAAPAAITAAAAAAAAMEHQQQYPPTMLPVSSRAYSMTRAQQQHMQQQQQEQVAWGPTASGTAAVNGMAAGYPSGTAGAALQGAGGFAAPYDHSLGVPVPYDVAMAPYAGAVYATSYGGDAGVPLLTGAGGFVEDMVFANRQVSLQHPAWVFKAA